MRMSTRALVLAILGLGMYGLSVSDAAAPGVESGIPAKAIAGLIETDAKLLKETLAAGKFSKKDIGKTKARLKGAAMSIAAYAQAGLSGPEGKKMAGVRDAAIKFAKGLDALKEGADVADLNKLVDSMAKLDAGEGDPAPVDLATLKAEEGTLFEIDHVMTVFKKPVGGGLDYEKGIRDIGKKGGDAKTVAHMGYKVAVLAEYTSIYGPERDEGKKTKASWAKFCEEMKKSSIDMAQAAEMGKAGDAKLKAAAKKLDKSCTDCHDVFRVD